MKDHPKQEREVLEYWDKEECFQKSIDQRPEGNPYVFYDGPPFATGLPHYGHLVGSIMKDVVPRFWTMKGYRVERTWGWDCHGLPIENIVEQKFDLNSKEEIEKFGVKAFNDSCHKEVLVYAKEWQKVIHRLGRWVNMESSYKTMDLPYMESLWWVFKELWDKKLIYQGYKPMHICPRCETALSNFEVNQNYLDITDISVFVSFDIVDGDYSGVKMLAWTTTPWTLPGNVLLAIGKEMDYSVVLHEGEKYIVASALVEKVFAEKEYKQEQELKGFELVGAKYSPLFELYKDHEKAFQIVAADFVGEEEGTGIVHIAPAFGEDDKVAAEDHGVEPILHVGMNGVFTDELADLMTKEGYPVTGVPVRKKDNPQEVDIEIIKYLAHRGTLFAKKKIAHSYPHCWRCDTPLLNYGSHSWFVRVTDLKDRLVATNKEIEWVPENMKEGRFGKWLEGARDWAISRSRYWGTPLPIWMSESGEIICIGSVEELEQLSGKKIDNLHKHVVDEIEIEKDGVVYKRIPEVLDCWFESGAMPYAQLHYPFENESKFEQGFPAEFIAEGQDQTRGWFYTLHILANALFDMPAYKNVAVNGIVLAEDGKKMSKKLKNYPDPMEVMEKYGSDAVRFYMMSSPVVRAENIYFKEQDVHEVTKKLITILRNVLEFYRLYKESDDGREPSKTHVLDRWIFARLNETLEAETNALEAYDLQGASRPLQQFVTDLSTWYVRRSRDRFKVEGEDKKEALATLRVILDTFSKMIAPFMPFLAEIIYQEIDGGFLAREDRLSVHLEDWPETSKIDNEVIEKMGEVRAIVSRALDLREEAGRAVKQVLGGMTITVPGGEIDREYLDVVLAEVNIKDAVINKGEIAVDLDLELTPELIREGMVRDVVRSVNKLRKESGKTIQDRIELKLYSDNKEVSLMFEEYKEQIQEGTLSESIAFEKTKGVEFESSFRAVEKEIWIGF